MDQSCWTDATPYLTDAILTNAMLLIGFKPQARVPDIEDQKGRAGFAADPPFGQADLA
jgi:hypothetical protein